MSCQPMRKGTSARSGRVLIDQLERRVLLSAGDLDPSFGNAGVASSMYFGPVGSDARAVAVQSDGKLVMVGEAGSPAQISVARLNPNGTLDATFGSGGVLTLHLGASSIATSVGIQSDGKIVIGGPTSASPQSAWDATSDFAVVRLTSNGALDSTFNGTGIRTIDFDGGEDNLNDLLIQPDGRIVVAGSAHTSSGDMFALARLNSDGSLDSSFGTAGEAMTDIGAGNDVIVSAKLDSSGRIVVAGTSYTNTANTYSDICVARYTSAGALDTTFGSGGSVLTSWERDTIATAMTLTPAGKILVLSSAPTSSTATTQTFALAQYTSAGSLDTTFGNGGVSVLPLSTSTASAYPSGLTTTADGHVLASGELSDSKASISNILARVTSSGSLDRTYGTQGQAAVLAEAHLFRPIVLADGSCVAGGWKGNDSVVVHYTAAGALDTTFAGTGYAQVVFTGPIRAYISGSALQSDGKILAGGAAEIHSNGEEYALTRWNADGSLDSTFGAGGNVLLDLDGQIQHITAVAVQSDGKIVASGWDDSNRVVLRFTPTGALDPAFGSGGVVRLSSGFFQSAGANGLAIRSDGTIMLAAGYQTSSGYDEMAISRLTPTGSLDSTFGQGGTALVNAGTGFSPSSFVYAIQIDSNGDTLVGGNNSAGFVVARLDNAGNLDPAFASGGIASTALNGGVVNALALQADGKIVAAGKVSAGSSGSSSDFALARYNTDGTLDPTFGNGGIVQTDLTGSDSFNAVGVLDNGDILASGNDLVRYTPAGKLDPTFGYLGYSSIGGLGLQIRPDGSAIVVGTGIETNLDVRGPIAMQIQGGSNALPTPEAGGPYTVPEGGTVTFSGSATPAPGTTIGSYSWDFNYDGTHFNSSATGQSVSMSSAGIDGPSTRTIALLVTDSAGHSALTTTTLSVSDVPPTISATGPSTAWSDNLYTLNLSYSDPGPDPVSAWTINWGDGSAPQVYSGATNGLTHKFVSPSGSGPFTITCQVRNRDGTYSTNPASVMVYPAPVLSGNTLAVKGTAGDDTVSFSVVGSTLTVGLDAVSRQYSADVVTGISYADAGGNDSISNTWSQLLVLNFTSGDDSVATNGGPVLVRPGSGSLALTINNGTVTIDANPGTGIRRVNFSSLNIEAWNKLVLASSAAHANRSVVAIPFASFAIDSAATVDVGDNDLVLQNAGEAGQRGVGNLIADGYDASAWDGHGLTSSKAAANPTTYALGYALNDGSAGFAPAGGKFDGVSLTSSDVVVKFTYMGDADLNGQVTADDYFWIDLNQGNSNTTWTTGDFDYNGQTTADDYFWIDLNIHDGEPGNSLPEL